MANTTLLNATIMEASRFRINTQYFSPHDLSLFVESLETITRLKREKFERKEQNRLDKLQGKKRKFLNMPRIGSISTLNFNASLMEEQEDEEREEQQQKVMNLQPKSPVSDRSDYDETYFSAPSSSHSSPRSCANHPMKMNKKFSPSTLSMLTTSDSEESGIFPNNLNESPCSSPITHSSKLITKTRSLSARARLLRLIRRKETNSLPPVTLISHRPLDEYETLERYEQEQQQRKQLRLSSSVLMPQSEILQTPEKFTFFSTLNTKSKKNSRHGIIYTEDSPEVRFLDKALRYLTL